MRLWGSTLTFVQLNVAPGTLVSYGLVVGLPFYYNKVEIKN